MKISVRGIKKSFTLNNHQRQIVLGGVDIDVVHGEFVTILGPSGCGKTTLLKIIAGIEEPDEGEIIIEDSNRRIPIVWQELRLFPWRTVIKNVSFPLELGNTDQEEIKKKAQELLRITGLEDFEDYYPRQISGGMAQRVAIARCLATNSNCMLMDEPFASVDYITKQMLIKKVLEIRERQELTILYVTHDIRDAIELSDRILILSGKPAVIREIIRPNVSDSRRLELEKYIWNLLKIDYSNPKTNSFK